MHSRLVSDRCFFKLLSLVLRSSICKNLEESKMFADSVEKTLNSLKKKYKEEEIIDKTKRLKRVVEHLEILNELFNH